MATTLQGKLVPLRLSADGGTTFNKVVCRKTSDLAGTTSTTKENTECGVFTGLGPNAWTVSAEILVNTSPGAGEISKNALETYWMGQTRLVMRMETPDQGQASAGSALHLEGFCYITSLKITNTVGQLVAIQITLEGDGDLTYAA